MMLNDDTKERKKREWNQEDRLFTGGNGRDGWGLKLQK